MSPEFLRSKAKGVITDTCPARYLFRGKCTSSSIWQIRELKSCMCKSHLSEIAVSRRSHKYKKQSPYLEVDKHVHIVHL